MRQPSRLQQLPEAINAPFHVLLGRLQRFPVVQGVEAGNVVGVTRHQVSQPELRDTIESVSIIDTHKASLNEEFIRLSYLCMSFPLADASIVLHGDPIAKAARAEDTARSTSAASPEET